MFYIMASPNGNISALLALCEGNPPANGVSPHMQRPVTRCFDVFFDLRLNKRLSKQSSRHRVHYDVAVMESVFKLVFDRKLSPKK